uniref:DUF4283 domain-containing protein n=1 Tax=Brassica campestris TaxID=3711 RepID=A0A3P6BKX3_BRACM|nr:unnamed protein product [Brassica rapa]
MLSQWGMEDRITTNDLGNRKFLLNFTLEEDLSSVLRGSFSFQFLYVSAGALGTHCS